MTKSWDHVKDEACRLYSQGATLSEVQATLEQTRKFRASTRAFRGKFKEWKVTRASQLNELKAKGISATWPPTGVDNHVIPSHGPPEVSMKAERSRSEPPETKVVRTSTTTPFSHDSLRRRRSSLEPLACDPLRDSFEALYQELQRAATGAEISVILAKTRFVSGEDCIIHYSAAKPDIWTLDYLVDYMNINDYSIDIESSGYLTALEYAIGAGQKNAVELLAENGASLSRRNRSDQQPLHYAIQECPSPDICIVLLQQGANVNAPCFQKPLAYCSSIALTLERLSKAQDKQERQDLAHVFEALTEHGAKMEVSNGTATATNMDFLKHWYTWNPLSFKPKNYLRSDFHPLCWFPRKHCPTRECNSLASFVFHHTPSSGLAELLIQATDLARHGHDLLEVLLSPCSQQATERAIPTTFKLFHDLLEGMTASGVEFRDDPTILHKILDRGLDEERLHLVEAASRWNLVTVSESRECLTQLGLTSNDLELRLAELLLSLPGMVPTEVWTTLMAQHYSNGGMFRRNSVSMANDSSRQELQSRVVVVMGFGSQLPPDVEIQITRHVAHVWTKGLLEGEKYGYQLSAQQLVFGSVQLRREYGLPALPIPSELILEMFPHINHRHGLETGSTDLSSDYGPSPSTTAMGELPDADIRKS